MQAQVINVLRLGGVGSMGPPGQGHDLVRVGSGPSLVQYKLNVTVTTVFILYCLCGGGLETQ